MAVMVCVLALLTAALAVCLCVQVRARKKESARNAARESEYERQISGQTAAMRDLYFARLLLGGYYRNLGDLRADGKPVEIDFPNDAYVLLIARLETWGELFTDKDQRDVKFILRNVLEHAFPGITYAADVRGDMTAILNLPSDPEPDLGSLVRDARRGLEVLESEFGLTVTIALSRAYHSPLELSTAYDDACRVLEFRQLLEDDAPVTTYEELTYPHVGALTCSYLDLEQQLLQCARHSDFPQMRKLLHEMIDLGFGTSAATVETVRFRVYGAVNLLLYLADDLRAVVGNEVIDRIDPGPRLTSARSLGEIVTVIDEIFDALEAHNAKTQQTVYAAWVDELPGYIEAHYRDPNVNVSAIADHFGLTATYCSKLYKERYGQLLRDAIALRRLAEAKELLATDRNLNQIAEESGFSSTLTMSRAFKKFEGVSALRFRTGA